MRDLSAAKTAVAEKPRGLIYCQHVLGIGHLIRTLAIARELEQWSVTFVNGGEPLSGANVLPWVSIENLPPISSDSEFQKLNIRGYGTTLEQVQQARKHRLLELFESIRPNVLLIELFPFGRKRFAFELLPLLAHIRLSACSTKVVCSLRDILVTKPDPARHEDWVVDTMNRYFDLLLIHSDPTVQTLDESFSRGRDLRCEVQYTGFVTQNSATHSDPPIAGHAPSSHIPLILASVGGGRVGYELLELTIRAARLLTIPYQMRLFTGPYMPEQQCQALYRLASRNPHLEVSRFSSEFQSLMQQASLSISMAGYNTCMNLLMTGTRALVLPFTGHKNDEQTIRAKKLEQRGLLTRLEPADLDPERLARKIELLLNGSHIHPGHSINTAGGKETASAIERLMSRPCSRIPRAGSTLVSAPMSLPDQWLDSLRRFLDGKEASRQELHLFLRDDDVDEDEDSLQHLLDLALARNVPMNLEIIPGRLTTACTTILKNALRADHSLLSLDQHGWTHSNHEMEGRKCEFGRSRSFQQQLDDIARGKAILESTFEDLFYPAFTPPWNRCTRDTYQALDELGFQVLSKDRGKERVVEYRFSEISTNLDLYTWKDGERMKSPYEIVRELMAQWDTLSVVGILLHHKVMTEEAFQFLDQILCELRRHPMVRFHTFHTLLPLVRETQTVPR